MKKRKMKCFYCGGEVVLGKNFFIGNGIHREDFICLKCHSEYLVDSPEELWFDDYDEEI